MTATGYLIKMSEKISNLKNRFTKRSSYGSDLTFVHGQLLIDVISGEDLPDLEGNKFLIAYFL